MLVRSMFIDFSSAFNTLKPDFVINKLRTLNVSPILCKFILDFLTNREQIVRINEILCRESTVLSISTGAPQGCVLSAYLLINLSEPFFDTTIGPRPNLACVDRDETGSHQKN